MAAIKHLFRGLFILLQTFDVKTLSQREDLGKDFHFGDAVEPGKRLVELYKRLSLSALDDFPQKELTTVKNKANEDYTLFDEILKFDPKAADPTQQHKKIINTIKPIRIKPS